LNKQKKLNYLYVAYSKLTPLQCKIGITDNLEHRLHAFHTTDHTIRFVKIKRRYSRQAIFDLETSLHRRFADSRSDRGKEYFYITPAVFLWLLGEGAILGIINYWLRQEWR
jgi:hypothetical protein